MARFVLWGTYCDNALQRRGPFREEHLAGLRQQQQDGVLITLGPTEGSTHVFGIYEASTQQVVETLLQQDVYWRNGIWTELKVYPWIQAF
ncbi:MAG: YciI family protein [Prochlorococcaceae cyanobacterium]